MPAGRGPRDAFLQWEVDGIPEPTGRGSFYQADARLIAAAPELLEACVNFLAWLDLPGDAALQDFMTTATNAEELARAAIAKATGVVA